ncbi:EGFR-like transmembrane domain-containing protein [Aspergillus foveolatus]|uniref:EGFR-like transmembrane domain-containing protein n=1 Tax=Aspergillus foveolatus TaxID=210207 RepID=UPI003CCDEDD0
MTHFKDYYFTSNVTEHICPTFEDFSSPCNPPNACASDPKTGKLYCCDYKDDIGVGALFRAERGAVLMKNCLFSIFPLGALLDGMHSHQEYREDCTSLENQINICWNKERSVLGNISSNTLNGIYSSLSAEAPSATTWAFDPQSLLPATSSTLISTPSTTPDVTTSPPSSPNDDSSSALSGGAIAGIVIGVVAAVAILGGAAYLLKRRRQRQHSTPGYMPAELAHEAPSKAQLYEADSNAVNPSIPPQELPARQQ